MAVRRPWTQVWNSCVVPPYPQMHGSTCQCDTVCTYIYLVPNSNPWSRLLSCTAPMAMATSGSCGEEVAGCYVSARFVPNARTSWHGRQRDDTRMQARARRSTQPPPASACSTDHMHACVDTSSGYNHEPETVKCPHACAYL